MESPLKAKGKYTIKSIEDWKSCVLEREIPDLISKWEIHWSLVLIEFLQKFISFNDIDNVRLEIFQHVCYIQFFLCIYALIIRPKLVSSLVANSSSTFLYQQKQMQYFSVSNIRTASVCLRVQKCFQFQELRESIRAAMARTVCRANR